MQLSSKVDYADIAVRKEGCARARLSIYRAVCSHHVFLAPSFSPIRPYIALERLRLLFTKTYLDFSVEDRVSHCPYTECLRGRS